MRDTNRTVTRALTWAAALLILLALTAGLNVSARNSGVRSGATLDDLQYFREFSLKTAGGGVFTQERLKDARVTVINGWGPWCVGCVNEMPDLEELSREMAAEGVRFAGVVADYVFKTSVTDPDYDARIAEAVAATGVTYPILLSDERFENEVSPTMHDGYPGTWIVDGDGRLLEYVSGELSKEKWEKTIRRVLDGKGTYQWKRTGSEPPSR